MPPEITQYLIVCPLALLAGFVDAVAGGGGLISLPAYLIAGLPVHFAIGTNKLNSATGSAIAAWKFAQYIPWRQSGFYVLCAFAGSGVGAKLALMLGDSIFRRVMLVILPLTALYILRGKALDEEKPPFPPRKALFIGGLVTLGIGVYDGFYGPGSGPFLLLLLTSAAHLRLSSANGLSKVISLTTNLSSLAIFLLNGKVMLLLGLAASCFSAAGSWLGARYFEKHGAKAVKSLMLAVLVIFFIRVLTE